MARASRGGKSGGSPRPLPALRGSSRNAATTFRIPRALRRASGTSGLGTDSAKARARVADGSIEGRGWFERTSPRRRARRRSTGSVGERRRATRARGAREGDGRAGPCPRVVPEVGRTSGGASAIPRAGTRARARGLACGFGKGRDGRMRQTNGGKARGRAGRARGPRPGRTSRASKHGRGAARGARGAPALILALGRTRTSRRGGSIREWAHRRGRVARRRHHARGKPRGGHETATRVRAASWTRRAREMQTTAGARDVARAARYEPLGRDEADQTKMTMRVTRAGVVLASIVRSAGDESTKK